MNSGDLIVVTGLTASGKSDFALRCVEYLKNTRGIEAEIVNADSIQMYDELKILTAYPSAEQLNRVPHHLYGILSPNEDSSVAKWLEIADEKINFLRKAGKIPIVCGGTGFYVSALIGGISNIPQIPRNVREEVARKFQTLGREAFFNELKILDPESGNILHKNDAQRILRAYEVASYTGKTLSEWQKVGKEGGYQATITILLPPRNKLNEKCLARVNKMAESGAADEVKAFIEKYPDYRGPLSNVIGYREIISLLKGEISREKCIDLMYIRTKQYAKRQSVWFRNKLPSSKPVYKFGNEIDPAICEKNFE
ncbi:MAG: tRNA (adenosine(37)-N6)-dimethylallyltransferase MiaA [Holosporaceae bacterium]|jgi:tRNA dimethylallyltransferase|nr:tRNA (adenosine(37)-N6)-dimethylallyltransferase MiaA [Holosporaceae bacterium]